MKWPRGPWRRAPVLGDALAAGLAAYQALERPPLHAGLERQRVVVVDVESSGLDPRRDRLISIGAVVVRGGLLRLDESFQTLLQQERPSSDQNILVHRIGAFEQLSGGEPSVGLLDFLTFAGKDPLIAFHADFDRVLIERAARAALGAMPDNTWLDLAALAPALFPGRAGRGRALDDWLRAFGIEHPDRHNALADAVATAQLLLAALAAAREQGLSTWAQLRALQKGYRWLGPRH